MPYRSRESVISRVTALLEQGFVLIDLETTGLDKDPNVEIIEVAILNHQGQVLLDTLVKPQLPIPAVASCMNGIYDADVVDAPPFEAVYDAIASYLNGQHVVAYNDSFERNILNAVCHRHAKARFEPASWWCAMRGYATYIRSRRWQKLTQACVREKITVENQHRALGDCRLTLALMYVMTGMT